MNLSDEELARIRCAHAEGVAATNRKWYRKLMWFWIGFAAFWTGFVAIRLIELLR